MICADCKEYMEGDGYKVVLHCPDAEGWECREPDSAPVYCGFVEEL